jgi:hypothetical protein
MRNTKKVGLGVIVGAVAVLGFATVSLAASGLTLVSAGLGQKAGDTMQFGVAICNQGGSSLASPAPLSVTANNTTVVVNSAAPLSVGACGYAYLSYGTFGMSAGKTYSVQVVIDPNKTLGATIGAPAFYTVAVPSAGSVLGANTISDVVRQQLLAQLASMVTTLQALFAKAKALGL